MKYDIPGHSSVTLYKNSSAIVFPLPYPANGPDADLLAAYPLVQVVGDAAVPVEAPEATALKPSRKEV